MEALGALFGSPDYGSAPGRTSSLRSSLGGGASLHEESHSYFQPQRRQVSKGKRKISDSASHTSHSARAPVGSNTSKSMSVSTGPIPNAAHERRRTSGGKHARQMTAAPVTTAAPEATRAGELIRAPVRRITPRASESSALASSSSRTPSFSSSTNRRQTLPSLATAGVEQFVEMEPGSSTTRRERSSAPSPHFPVWAAPTPPAPSAPPLPHDAHTPHSPGMAASTEAINILATTALALAAGQRRTEKAEKKRHRMEKRGHDRELNRGSGSHEGDESMESAADEGRDEGRQHVVNRRAEGQHKKDKSRQRDGNTSDSGPGRFWRPARPSIASILDTPFQPPEDLPESPRQSTHEPSQVEGRHYEYTEEPPRKKRKGKDKATTKGVDKHTATSSDAAESSRGRFWQSIAPRPGTVTARSVATAEPATARTAIPLLAPAPVLAPAASRRRVSNNSARIAEAVRIGNADVYEFDGGVDLMTDDVAVADGVPVTTEATTASKTRLRDDKKKSADKKKRKEERKRHEQEVAIRREARKKRKEEELRLKEEKKKRKEERKAERLGWEKGRDERKKRREERTIEEERKREEKRKRKEERAAEEERRKIRKAQKQKEEEEERLARLRRHEEEADEQRRAEEKKKRKEEKRKKKEAKKQRKAEEERRAAEEARRKAEEERRIADEAKRKADEQQRAEAKRREKEQRKLKAEELARKKERAAARRQAQLQASASQQDLTEEGRQRLEEERKKREEEREKIKRRVIEMAKSVAAPTSSPAARSALAPSKGKGKSKSSTSAAPPQPVDPNAPWDDALIDPSLLSPGASSSSQANGPTTTTAVTTTAARAAASRPARPTKIVPVAVSQRFRLKTSEKLDDEALRGMLIDVDARDEFLASKWISIKELQRLETAGILTYKRGKFSEEERQALRDWLDEFGKSNLLTEEQVLDVIMAKKGGGDKNRTDHPTFWVEMASQVPGRPVRYVKEAVKRMYDPRARKGPWTKEEDTALRTAFEQHPHEWTKIAAMVDRSESDCRDRWRGELSQVEGKRGGKWTPEEEEALIKAVTETNAKIGRGPLDPDTPWDLVVKLLGGTRSMTQCRKKWQDHLAPRLRGESTVLDVSQLVKRLREMDIEFERDIRWNEVAKGMTKVSASIARMTWHRLKQFVPERDSLSFPAHLDRLDVLIQQGVVRQWTKAPGDGKNGDGDNSFAEDDHDYEEEEG